MPGHRFLELGRSCVLKSYRNRTTTMQLLWKGLHGLCRALFHRSDVRLRLAWRAPIPTRWRCRCPTCIISIRCRRTSRCAARPELYVPMNRMPKEAIDPKEGMRTLPPLLKGYVRAGAASAMAR